MDAPRLHADERRLEGDIRAADALLNDDDPPSGDSQFFSISEDCLAEEIPSSKSKSVKQRENGNVDSAVGIIGQA